MCAANDRLEHAPASLRDHAEADPSAHRITPVVGALDAGVIKHGNDVLYVFRMTVGRSLVRLIALPMAARVHQAQLAAGPERRHIAVIAPVLDALREAVLKHQRRPAANDFVMNAYPVIDSITH